jgi:hypothetical protein
MAQIPLPLSSLDLPLYNLRITRYFSFVLFKQKGKESSTGSRRRIHGALSFVSFFFGPLFYTIASERYTIVCLNSL